MYSEKKNIIHWKVCGMRQPENIIQLASLHPHYMGFIFYAKSPRYVGSEFQIPTTLQDSVKRVGVFVNEDSQIVVHLQRKHKLDFIQLHGEESVDYCLQLKESGLKLIKAFSIHDGFDFKSLLPYESASDFFLFDTKGKLYGGNGVPFNWKILNEYRLSVPFFLSGGLNPSNVGEALAIDHPMLHAMDLNSGVESAPGLKDYNRVSEITKILNV